ncbi:tubulin polymerization-promoting protein family member hypothetical protein [Limosa lapponica baueri]|uniref:Uncharacterized protein n=1 Tax=Limosa lapponica baueri TaxID=1758121 RepID=A0A2I0U8T9_LIMLA|nr:tubulin polymerization-promoting protein family member hypothetical protein [Limosa lapponica baueri]
MKEICSKCFKGKLPKEALQAVYGLIEVKEPSSVGATVSMSFLTHCAPRAAMGPFISAVGTCAILTHREEFVCDLFPNAGCLLQKITKVGGVERLTDPSKYIGSHNEHFDESGKGKGLAGCQDLADDRGYIGAYKGAGTYD